MSFFPRHIGIVILKLIAHVSQKENNYIINVLEYRHIEWKMLECKPLSVLERAIMPTGFVRPIFLEICFSTKNSSVSSD